MVSKITGMGLTAPPRDPRALAEAICEVVAHRERYIRPRAPIAEQFSPLTAAAQYEELFGQLLS
jgi:glycosyltransferase involved in cell wall biosynthesis